MRPISSSKMAGYYSRRTRTNSGGMVIVGHSLRHLRSSSERTKGNGPGRSSDEHEARRAAAARNLPSALVVHRNKDLLDEELRGRRQRAIAFLDDGDRPRKCGVIDLTGLQARFGPDFFCGRWKHGDTEP